MQPLKLVALDTEDLAILSAQLQDAVMRLADISYQPKDRRFAMIVNRFDWPAALAQGQASRRSNERRRAAIRFEHVSKVLRQNISQAAPDTVLALLAMTFEPVAQPPSGTITLVFAAGAAIKLEVDYIEAELRDLGAAWTAATRPDHENDVQKPRGGALPPKAS